MIEYSKENSMKTLIRKNESSDSSVAQCCAKVSTVVAGCHD